MTVSFDDQDRFIVGDISKQILDHQYIVLRELAVMAASPNMQAVEIGSWTGLSAVLIGEVIQRVNGNLYSIDWYKGSTDGAAHLKAATEVFDVPSIFRQNIEHFKLENTVQLWIKTSEEAAKEFKDRSLNFIFIDGDHTYEAVKKDINLWYPKLMKNGIICGHDYKHNNSAVCLAVDELLPGASNLEDIWWIRRMDD